MHAEYQLIEQLVTSYIRIDKDKTIEAVLHTADIYRVTITNLNDSSTEFMPRTKVINLINS